MINDYELAEQEQAEKEASQAYEEHQYQNASDDDTHWFIY